MKNLLNRKEYLNDKLKFSYVDQNRRLDTAIVYSDDETYSVVQGNVDVPVWVWTLENLSLDKLKEVKFALTKLLNEELHVTSRKEVFEYLLNSKYLYLDKDSYFELGFLECKKAVKPKETDGYLGRVKKEELDLLTQYYYLDRQELPFNSLTLEQAYEKCKTFLEDKNFYVWRNTSGRIVAYLSYREFDGVAKLSNVYTVPTERRKGYCVNLVYEVTKKLLDSGLRVMLYTDYNYSNSNEAYKKVGFEDFGYLVNYTLKRK